MKLSYIRYLLVLAVLVSASLACNFPAGGEATSAPTQPPVNPEEAQQLEDQLQATLSESGEVTLTITEQQLNSYMVAKLAEEPEQLLSNPRVELTSGQILVYGQVTQAGISADTKITMQPNVDENGNPRLDVVSIDLGPFPVPQALRDRVDGMVNDALADYMAASSNQFRVNSITVVEDQMTVTGVKQ